MYPHKGEIDLERYQKALEAKAFFMRFLNADCPRIAVENPRPLKVVGLPEETQRIQPFQFGEPYSKLTYLWLKNLPPPYNPQRFLMCTSLMFLVVQVITKATRINPVFPVRVELQRLGQKLSPV